MINLKTLFKKRSHGTRNGQSYFINGVRKVNGKTSRKQIGLLKNEWKTFVRELPSYPGGFEGRGIVTCAGGLKYFTCAWVGIHLLRKQGCKLPIELWYAGKELSPEIIEALGNLDVTCNNVLDYNGSHVAGYALKPFAILNSSFKQVLFLDADNNCMADPAYLFDSEIYKRSGAVFWPDIWRTDKNNPMWKIIESDDYNSMEQESGQLLINKEKCWRELNLCMHFNIRRQDYYTMLLGDKDTFRFAWMALRTPFHMIATPVAHCGVAGSKQDEFYGVSLVQHDFDGNILFLHRNLLKWDITGNEELVWRAVKRLKPGGKKLVVSNLPMGKDEHSPNFVNIRGDTEMFSFVEQFGDIEKECLQILRSLRHSSMYARFMLYTYMNYFRPQQIALENIGRPAAQLV